jgi:CheY-like chemotaxis protein
MEQTMGQGQIPEFIVIDDDEINNMLCREYILLAFPNADIHTYTKPQEGLDYIRGHYGAGNTNAAMLFLDINMPVMSGWEVLEVFSDFPESIKGVFTIYLLTSSVDSEDKENADASGLVSGFIEKPLAIRELQAIFPGMVRDI